MIDYTSFSHGQVHSKLWLCEQIEPLIKSTDRILIHGSWYNTLGFMLNCRKPKYYQEIRGIDIDNDSILIADKINNAWVIDEPNVFNEVADASVYDSSSYDVIINSSGEHFADTKWFDNVLEHQLVCIQSVNITEQGAPWFITQPTPDYESFMEKYPLKNTVFSGTKRIQYSNGWGYDRYMTIGYK